MKTFLNTAAASRLVNFTLYAIVALSAIENQNYLAAALAILIIVMVDLVIKQGETMRVQREVISLMEHRHHLVTDEDFRKEFFKRLAAHVDAEEQ